MGVVVHFVDTKLKYNECVWCVKRLQMSCISFQLLYFFVEGCWILFCLLIKHCTFVQEIVLSVYAVLNAEKLGYGDWNKLLGLLCIAWYWNVFKNERFSICNFVLVYWSVLYTVIMTIYMYINQWERQREWEGVQFKWVTMHNKFYSPC